MPSLPQSMVFQSTLPLRGATRRRRPVPSGLAISIHTPLAGSDLAGHAGIAGTGISIHTPLAGSDYAARVVHGEHVDFNPHSPCGERPNHSRSIQQSLTFQSTLPLRGATAVLNRYGALLIQFQSTLPLRGATCRP